MPNRDPPRPAPFHNGAFGALTHDRGISTSVLATYIQQDDNVTASITAGSPYFKDLHVVVYDLVLLEADPSLILHGHPTHYWDTQITANSDGITPISAKKGQYVVAGVTAEVPEHALAPGAFTGTMVLTTETFSEAVDLVGTYLAVGENKPIGQKWGLLGAGPFFWGVRTQAKHDPDGGGVFH